MFKTGSLVNELMIASNKSDLPEIGSGATLLSYSDRHPVTVIDVDKQKKIVIVQEDYAKRIDDNGMSDCQDYEYYRNEDGYTEMFRLNKLNEWESVRINKETGRIVKRNGQRYIRFGIREKYHDFSF